MTARPTARPIATPLARPIAGAGDGGGASLLLDAYEGVAAAYDLVKLRTAYSGASIRVRRSSDNTEQDFGFVNNVLDTSSLLTFCGGGNGFITTWYDQSGNGRNSSQATTTNQPRIVSSGIVDDGVYFNASNVLDSGVSSFNLADMTICFKLKADNATFRRINSFASGLNFIVTTSTMLGVDNSGGPTSGLSGTVAAVTNFNHMAATRSGTTYNLSVNGAAFTTSGGTAPSYTRLYIGGTTIGTGSFLGNMKTVIVFDRALTLTELAPISAF